MKRIKLIAWGGILLAFPLLLCLTARAQTTQLRGIVKNETDQTGVPNASVTLVVKKTVISTMTDNQGNFTLNVPAFQGVAELTISSVGYGKKIVQVQPGQTPISIVLQSSNGDMLDNVVVTALGVKKARKAVAYAVTEVNGSEFTQARENNVANALSGKIAGVNAAGLSTGPGGSSRVTIRGNGSLNGDNQPLYVINGMPIDNSVPGGAPTVNGISFNVDKGDGIAGMNPDDIESITVLKGGTAAALYGSRASNGVILITTKKGKAQRGIGVEYNSTVTMENVAVTPDFQYEYGQGDAGVKPTTLQASINSGRRSWGAKIDGSKDYVGMDGNTHPYEANRDNLKNFYQTGTTFTNSLAFTGGSDRFNYRFSGADLNSKGILPNTTYKRKTFNVSINARPSDKITIEAVAQYNLEEGRNRTGAGDALGNPNWTPLEIANTADVRWLEPGYDANGNEFVWSDASIVSNGYFVINKWKESDTKNRFIGQASVSYELIKNLVFKGTVSRDFYNYNYENIMPTGTAYIPAGQYAGLKSDVSETNSMVTGTYKTGFFEKAVQLLKDDMIILTGGGTTIREFIKKIPTNLRATFITVNVLTAVELLDKPMIKTIMIGGQISTYSQMTVSGEVFQYLANIKADLCIIGTNAIDANSGLTDSDWETVQVKKAMIKAASTVAIMTISEKMNSVMQMKIADINDINYLITELPPDSHELHAYKAKNLTLL